jgi:hypothetical protein
MTEQVREANGMMTESIKPVRMKVSEVIQYLRIGRTKLWAMIGDGLFELHNDVPGGDQYITTDQLDHWVANRHLPHKSREEAQRQFLRDRGRLT